MRTKFELDLMETAVYALKQISDTLIEIQKSMQKKSYAGMELPDTCMDFVDWASRLDSADREKVMKLLWSDEYFRKTCIPMDD